MQIYYNKNYDETHSINEQVATILRKNCLSLNNLLKSLKIDNYNVNLYLQNLTNCLVEIGAFQKVDYVFKEFGLEFNELNLYPDLKEKFILASLKLIKYENYQDKGLEEVNEIVFIDLLRSSRIMAYYAAKALTAIMEKDKALRYFQNFTNKQIQEDPDFNFTVEMVEYILEGAKHMYANTHHFASFIWKEGTACWKARKCMWHEILKDLDDRDFTYSIACYGDFETAKRFNSNFILTRTQTLMQGASYCDFCWHDLRIVSEPEHPPKEVWDSIK